jgi:ubiquinone/menaquinone biosynthesis C-methylase UbiE
MRGGSAVKRHESIFIRRIADYCRGKDVLEIGCGNGTRLAEVVPQSRSWIGIDPDSGAVEKAKEANLSANAEFVEGHAETLVWPAELFDVVIFTLSLHHIDFAAMSDAISEAIRVLRPDGLVLFLEPMPEGTFFDAEKRFGCCDGDERKQLAYAYYSMLSSEQLSETEEFVAQVSVEYDSFDDFSRNVPTKDGTQAKLEAFLAAEDFKLDEKWRLNVFSRAG